MNETLSRALQLHQAGQLEEARHVYETLLDSDPQNADASHLLGLVMFQQGDTESARERVSTAIALRPDDPVIRNNFGEVLRAMRHDDEAAEQYHKALELHADYPEPHNNLAVIMTAQGNFIEARQHCERALALRPEYADAWYNLGLVWQNEGNWPEAAGCYERCIDLGGAFPDVFNNLALCRQQDNDWDAARGFYRRALELDPAFLPALNNLAELCEKSGALEEAASFNQHALNAAPDDAHALLVAARLLLRKNDLPGAVQHLREIATGEIPAELDQAVQFELGQMLDRAGDYEDAFAAFSRANQLQSGDIRYPDVRPERFLDRLSNSRDAVDQLEWKRGAQVPGAPVFLVGFPRSGTTLLDQILDSHPKLQVMEERPCLESVQRALELESGSETWHLDLNRLSPVRQRHLRLLYFEKAGSFLQLEKDCTLVDKYPLNITRLALIQRLFPGAKIVLSLRHPCDVALSCFMQQFTPNDAMANLNSLESGARAYGLVMDLWESCCSRLDPDVHTVRYEDLVNDFDGTVSACLEFLGLDWADSVRDFAEHAMDRERISTPSYRQVSRPLYSSAVGRWENYRGFFGDALKTLEPWIKRWGYSTG